MKVIDVMQKEVDFVTADTSIEEASRLIFGRNINGLPVCKDKKVVGFITERDILANFYPSMEEFIEDPVHLQNFEEMEKRISQVLALPVKKIMNQNVVTVTPDTPLLKAESLMLVKKVGRLPVVDEKGELVAILAKGDIFRALVGQKLPFAEEKGFRDWWAKQYDNLTDWDARLKNEISYLLKLFKKKKIKKILDVASGTGEHVIALAKKGYNAVGFDSSAVISSIAEAKRKKLDKTAVQRASFIQGTFDEASSELPADFDAAIFMGNALSHVLYDDKNIIKKVARVLKPGGILVFQIINYEKLFAQQASFRNLRFKSSNFLAEGKHAFLTLYDRIKNSKYVNYTVAVFDKLGETWRFRRLNSTPIAYVDRKEIIRLLKRAGFAKISFLGANYYEKSGSLEFDPRKSDWLYVVAERI